MPAKPSTNSDSSETNDEILAQAQGGASFEAFLSDGFDDAFKVVTGTLPTAILAHAVNPVEAKIRAKTGQTSIGDDIKWGMMPTTMAEEAQQAADKLYKDKLTESANADTTRHDV